MSPRRLLTTFLRRRLAYRRGVGTRPTTGINEYNATRSASSELRAYITLTEGGTDGTSR